MQINKSDSPAKETVSAQQVDHFFLLGELGLRQVTEILGHARTVAEAAEQDFPVNEWVHESGLCIYQNADPLVSDMEMVDPDRAVDHYHSASVSGPN